MADIYQDEKKALGEEVYENAAATLESAALPAPAYNGSYDDTLRELYQKVTARPAFKYDVDGDAVYQQYKDSYTSQGRLAMKDSMGQSAALTGGYASSYSQGVGQQQYDAYMQRLSDVIPELYSQAYQRYQSEGDALKELYSLTDSAAKTEYGVNLDKAAKMAQYGDFSGYKKLYGDQQGTLMENTWLLQNPALALKLGLIDQTKYYALTGTAPSGGSSSGGGGGGYVEYGMKSGRDVAELQRDINAVGGKVKVDGLLGSQTQSASSQYADALKAKFPDKYK